MKLKNRPSKNRKKTAKIKAKKRKRVLRRKSQNPHGKRAGLKAKYLF